MALNQDVAFTISANVQGQQAVDQLAASMKKLGQQGEDASRQMVWAMRMVPAQLTDIVTGLASGQNAMTVFIQQGGQLRDMFGSVSGALTAVGRSVLALITPLNVAAAAFAALGFAAYKGAEQSSELQKQLLLTGNAAGYTSGQIEQMARVLANTQGIAAGTARDLTTGLAATGQLVGKNLDDAAAAGAKLQKLSGQSADEIVKDFARMSNGVAAWAAEHNRQYNFLSLAQFKHIKLLEDQGKREEAISATIAALNESLDGRKRSLGFLEQAWDAVGKAASSAWDKMLNIGRAPSSEESLANWRAALANLENKLNNPTVQRNIAADTPWAKQFLKQLDEARAKVVEYQTQVDASQQNTVKKAQEAAQARLEIDNEVSGKTATRQMADLQLELTRAQGAAEERIALLDLETQRIENAYRVRKISEEEYNREKLRLAKSVLNERMKLLEQEISIEKRKPGDTPADVTQREARIQALINQIGQFSSATRLADEKSSGDRAAFLQQIDNDIDKFNAAQRLRATQITTAAELATKEQSSLALRQKAERERIMKESEDLARGKPSEAASRIREEAAARMAESDAALAQADALNAVAAAKKISTSETDRIVKIYEEADAVGLTSYEYRKRSELMRIDRAARDAAMGVSDEYRQKILAEAEAQKKATATALDYAEARAKSFAVGATTAMKDYVEAAGNAANQAKNLFSNAFKGMEDALVDFVKTGKLDFKSLADSIISDMIRITIQRQILAPFAGMLGGMFGGGGDPGINLMYASENGNIMTSSGPMPLNTYAAGGVTSRPQVALFGEGSTPEAFVPLPDGRTIPVTMRGDNGGTNVTVNVVNNANGTQATATERRDNNGGRIIEVMIEQVKASIAADISRGVGTVPSALERTYGANRTAGAY